MHRNKLLTLIGAFIFMCETVLSSAGAETPPTAAFFESYKKCNIQQMSGFFSDIITFIGDPKFIGDKAAGPGPIVIAKRDLIERFSRLFSQVGNDAWLANCNKMNPELKEYDGKDQFFGMAQVGDWIYDLKAREAKKGSRKGFDEAVIFIFRKKDNKWVIASIIADF